MNQAKLDRSVSIERDTFLIEKREEMREEMFQARKKMLEGAAVARKARLNPLTGEIDTTLRWRG